MALGTLYGIGIGPGDPELITLKGARLLAEARTVFVPKARIAEESLARTIAGRHLGPKAEVRELVFPMTRDEGALQRHWLEAAEQVAAVLDRGEDACFLTLGDPFLYSTYIYLVRALRQVRPEVRIETVPGIMALNAAAAAMAFPLGEKHETVTVVPAADDLTAVRKALDAGGTVVLMKIGSRLAEVLQVLEERGLLERAVLASRIGLPDQRLVTELRTLQGGPKELGYLSIILVAAGQPAKGVAS